MFGADREDMVNMKDFAERVGLMSLKTLKNISFEAMQNVYENQQRVVQVSKEFMGILFPCLEEKGNRSTPFMESISELLCSLITSSRDNFVQEMKKQITDYFMTCV